MKLQTTRLFIVEGKKVPMNKGMITSRYNSRIVSSNTNSTTSNECLEVDDKPSGSNWYVSAHNKPKATDNRRLSYTNKGNRKYGCRKIGSIWIEPEKESWRLSPIEIEQRKLYNKLRREYLKELNGYRRSTNKRVRETETTTVKVYNRSNFKDAIAFQRHSEIVRMSMG